MLAGLVVPAAALPALAQTPPRSSFCATAKRLDDAYTHLDEVDPDESVRDIEEGEDAFRTLADRAPVQLGRPLARILRFMPTLKAAAARDLDISDRKEGARYVAAAASAKKGFDKLYDYLRTKCKMDVG